MSKRDHTVNRGRPSTSIDHRDVVVRRERPPGGEPDFAILVAAGYRVLVDRLMAAVAERGIHGMRPSYGFVIRAVAAESPGVSRLAELLDTSKQAASKLVDSMVAAGFLARFQDQRDRRVLRLQLTAKSRRVMASSLETSAALEDVIAARVGAQGLAALREGLLAMVEAEGALDEVLSRRARPVW
jgi:DNA-binding MarR family transcriptional regulator